MRQRTLCNGLRRSHLAKSRRGQRSSAMTRSGGAILKRVEPLHLLSQLLRMPYRSSLPRTKDLGAAPEPSPTIASSGNRQKHSDCVHLKILGASITRTRTTASNAMAPPNHLATASIFFCDEANRVSHFMLEPSGQCRWDYLRPARKSVQSHA